MLVTFSAFWLCHCLIDINIIEETFGFLTKAGEILHMCICALSLEISVLVYTQYVKLNLLLIFTFYYLGDKTILYLIFNHNNGFVGVQNGKAE